jgi:hypothetical protein
MADTGALDTSQDSNQDPGIGSLASSVTSDLAKVQKAKIGAESGELAQMEKRQSSDRGQMDAYLKAEGAGPETLKPWNAELEHKKFETNPIEGLGSTGAIFAMIASAFTKAPMLSALEGMTGALNGIKEGNEASYTRAYESWQQNMKLAEQRQKMQHELYNDALTLSEHDSRLSEAKLKALAARFDDQKMLTMIEHGMVPEIYQTLDARNKAMSSMLDVKDKFTIHAAQTREAEATFKEIDQTQNLPPLVKEAQKTAAIMRIYGKKDAQSPQYELMGMYFRQHPGATVEEATEYARQNGILPQHLKPGDLAAQQGYEQEISEKETQQGRPLNAQEKLEIKNRWFGQPGSKGSPSKAMEAQAIEDKKKELREQHPDWPEWKLFTEASNTIKTESAAGTKMEDKDVERLAEQGAAGDTTWSQGLGRTAQGLKDKARINARITDILIARNQGGADLAMINAKYQGLKAAERTSATQEQKMGSAAYEASQQGLYATQLSEKVPRSRLVPFNKLVLAAKANFSDPDVNSFVAANNTFVNSYVRAISPTGISTDLVRQHAYDMLSSVTDDASYKRVMGVLQNEMSLAVKSPGMMSKRMQDEFKAGIEGNKAPDDFGAPTAAGIGGTVLRYDSQGNRIQ